MIVVGILAPGAPPLVGAIARRAAAAGDGGSAAAGSPASPGGARVELIGVAPAGADGDRALLDFVAAFVGHATVSRSSAMGIEPADLELALRYLPDVRVIVLVAPGADLLATAAAAATWSDARLVVVGPLDAGAMAALDSALAGAASPIVLDPPDRDPDGAFAGLVAALAARLDAGQDPTDAWQATLGALAVDPA